MASQEKHAFWRSPFRRAREMSSPQGQQPSASAFDADPPNKTQERWNMGILNDRHTDEVPGSILLLSKVSEYNEPLGLRHTPARTSASSLPSPYPSSRSGTIGVRAQMTEKKRTADGKIILEPQPTDSANDPLNWPVLRRDLALFSLGFYCMIGGGMTPILAAGFSAVAMDLGVTVPRVALTTGLYMMGLGLGSVVLSPTAILYGKRPVYLMAAVCFIISNVWCALSPNFATLVVARIFMGFAVSSVECLPSASIAEIYFLHEKAYRLGIYTLLLLGGKNLIPLVSAAIIQGLGWRWVFWIVAMVVGFAGILLFFFVPETFWDRSPKPHGRNRIMPHLRLMHSSSRSPNITRDDTSAQPKDKTTAERRVVKKQTHFASDDEKSQVESVDLEPPVADCVSVERNDLDVRLDDDHDANSAHVAAGRTPNVEQGEKYGVVNEEGSKVHATSELDDGETLRPLTTTDYFSRHHISNEENVPDAQLESLPAPLPSPGGNRYTKEMTVLPPQPFLRSLRPVSGRLSHDKWLRAMCRPFILFAYPSILWSALIYSLSIGWLIVLSESVSSVYENRNSYNFTPLQVGLVYISPFIGGILGTAVAGKISDIIVRFLARKNGGIYEPEFRLVMAIPIAITTVIGLMGFGWSAQERDNWIVPTIFFGLISFGCSLGSTTSITFAVDSYRQYAGEALVTLNVSKNILHGLVFSLFFNTWLQAQGSKEVFIALGGIQLACLLTTIPMYIYGKRGRMWTVRRNLMEKF